jgi:hypothetical protein
MDRLRQSGLFHSQNATGFLTSARPYVPDDQTGDMECMLMDMVLAEVEKEMVRVEDEKVRDDFRPMDILDSFFLCKGKEEEGSAEKKLSAGLFLVSKKNKNFSNLIFFQ